MSSRHVDVNGVLSLAAGVRLDEARTETLDLHTSLGLLLDVLDEKSLHRRSPESAPQSSESRRRKLTPGPTTLARTLKFLRGSISMKTFSSGHFL